MTEKTALARVLQASRGLYSALSEAAYVENAAKMLDLFSAAFSHCGNEKPLRSCVGRLKRGLKRCNGELYRVIKPCFSMLRPVPDYDFDKAMRHIQALIYGNDSIVGVLAAGDDGRARAMADAMKSYPGFLFGEFEALSDRQFYDLVFGFYPKLYDEPFMEKMLCLFEENG